MRGLKHFLSNAPNSYIGRIFYRCVDWNTNTLNSTKKSSVASFTDAWIETDSSKDDEEEVLVASFTDAWIET